MMYQEIMQMKYYLKLMLLKKKDLVMNTKKSLMIELNILELKENL